MKNTNLLLIICLASGMYMQAQPSAVLFAQTSPQSTPRKSIFGEGIDGVCNKLATFFFGTSACAVGIAYKVHTGEMARELNSYSLKNEWCNWINKKNSFWSPASLTVAKSLPKMYSLFMLSGAAVASHLGFQTLEVKNEIKSSQNSYRKVLKSFLKTI